jgi:uncharacterized membrane protein YkvI
MKKRIIIALFVLGVMAAAYLVLVFISVAAMLDSGTSGLILESMKNPYFAAIVLLLAISLFFTEEKFKQIVTDSDCDE